MWVALCVYVCVCRAHTIQRRDAAGARARHAQVAAHPGRGGAQGLPRGGHISPHVPSFSHPPAVHARRDAELPAGASQCVAQRTAPASRSTAHLAPIFLCARAQSSSRRWRTGRRSAKARQPARGDRRPPRSRASGPRPSPHGRPRARQIAARVPTAAGWPNPERRQCVRVVRVSGRLPADRPRRGQLFPALACQCSCMHEPTLLHALPRLERTSGTPRPQGSPGNRSLGCPPLPIHTDTQGSHSRCRTSHEASNGLSSSRPELPIGARPEPDGAASLAAGTATSIESYEKTRRRGAYALSSADSTPKYTALR